MDFDIQELKTRIVENQLMDSTTLESLIHQYQSETEDKRLDRKNLASWLGEQKAISQFQTEILIDEPEPRLLFGNYQLVDQYPENPNIYLAIHRLTKHPVKLLFVGGSDSSDLAHWRKVRDRAEQLTSVSHANVSRVFESVSIPEYRFIVLESPPGRNLKKLLPDNSRIPVVKANLFALQIANGIIHLRKHFLSPSSSLTESCWATKAGTIKIDHSLNSVRQSLPMPRQLANCWFRMVCGRLPKTVDADQIPKEELLKLKKFGMDVETIRLLNKLYRAKPDSVDELTRTIEHLNNDGCRSVAHQAPSTLSSYKKWLDARPELLNAENTKVQSIQIESGNPHVNADDPENLNINQPVSMETPFKENSTKQLRKMLLPAISSIILLSAIVAGVIALTFNLPNATVVSNKPGFAKPEPDAIEVDFTSAQNELTSPEPTSFMNQVLVEDDGETLWESPTVGPPIDFRGMPPAPKIAFFLHPAELFSNPQGQKLLASFGPNLNSQLNKFQERIGIPFSSIDQLRATFHSNQDFEYEVYFSIHLNEPVETAKLLEQWKTESRADGEIEYQFRNEQNCFWISSTETDTTHFCFGSESLIKEGAELHSIDSSTGIMKRLIAKTDSRRNFTFVSLRSALFSDEGQKWMSEYPGLNYHLSRTIGEVIRGFSLSSHLDQGSFVEIHVDHSADLPADRVKQNLNSLFGDAANNLVSYTDQMTSNPFWDLIRNRITQYASDFTNNFRWNVEFGQVIGNGWFPESAIQNMFAATELVLTLGPSQAATPVKKQSAEEIPQTLQQLLAAPRDLSVSTSPDLVILLDNLQQEILDDYGRLPFDFEIRLMGADLSKEGITQNQRPSDLEMAQKPLSEILTEIMVKANPDKNISGATDINCKMVWVVAADPDSPEREIILITTRSAAQAKGYELPAAFVTESQ